jgi:hypothetical protein
MKCNKCKKEKTKSEFPTAFDKRRRKTYIQKICKECKYEDTRQWRKANRDKCNASNKKWKKDNPEKVRETQRKTYWKFVDRRRKYNRELQTKIKKERGWTSNDIRRNGEMAKEIKRMNCEYCGTEENLCVHHKDNQGRHNLNKGLKPNNNINNLQILCRVCHASLHARERKLCHLKVGVV